MSGQTFVFLLQGVRGGLDYSFQTLAKNHCNFLLRSMNDLKFCKNKEHI